MRDEQDLGGDAEEEQEEDGLGGAGHQTDHEEGGEEEGTEEAEEAEGDDQTVAEVLVEQVGVGVKGREGHLQV